MRSVVVIWILGAALACQPDPLQDPGAVTPPQVPTAEPDPGPTWHGGIKQLVATHCSDCHQEGEVAPFSLTSFAEVHSMGSMVKDSVVSRRMPPWKAHRDCNEYENERLLSDAQIEKVQEWVDSGMPEGKPEDEERVETAAVPVEEVVLRADQILSLPVPYEPTQAPDDYRCFVIDWPETETRYVTGFEVLPDNRELLHHVIAFKIPPHEVATIMDLDVADPEPGYECFGSPGGSRPYWIGSWAPGGLARAMPEGTGMKIEPGSKIVVQTHYNLIGSDGGVDQSAVLFQLDDEVEREAQVMPWTNPQWLRGGAGMAIPAGAAEVKHAFEFAPVSAGYPFRRGVEIDIFTAGLHMHLLGRKAKLSIDHTDGTNTCLLRIDDWDFGWQGSYQLKQPVRIADGDVLRVECEWDNSGSNQPIIAGERMTSQDLQWGDGTRDEMCLGILYAAPAD